ncbi:jg16982 [Pararge aegeria aegeria]|uniref:Jg16982 protein n=1 Tax=Pararge aegeria aegeria TaxID=348720 RepID=A0A8S4RJJ7_9NEOP|nr:jg16982 [Pararge aegeria aegeria]
MTMVIVVRKYTVTFVLYFGCIVSCYPVFGQDAPEILDLQLFNATLGSDVNVTCSIMPIEGSVEWLFNNEPIQISERIRQHAEEKLLQEKDLDGNPRKYKAYNLTVANATSTDDGNYTCKLTLGEAKVEKTIIIDLSFAGRLVNKTIGPIKENVTNQANITMHCIFEVYKTREVRWWKKGKDDDIIELGIKPAKPLNLRQIRSDYDLHIRSPEDNGTYICEVWDPVNSTNVTGGIDVIIYAAPQVVVDTVIPISASQLFLNWTIKSYNADITGYYLMYRRLPSTNFNQYTQEKIGVKNISFVMEGLEKSTQYQLRLEVATTYGRSKPHTYESTVTTLDKDPIFVPNISINGFSATSVTIGWAAPPKDIEELIHYYLLEARKMNEVAPRRAYHSRDNRNLPYMFDNLEPHSTYVFRVSLLHLNESPIRFANGSGTLSHETSHASNSILHVPYLSVRFEELQPNTNYTIRLSAMTRTRRRGDEEVRHCTTAPAPPDTPPRPRWRKLFADDKYVFPVDLPRITERNGHICCYRIYMVRLRPHPDWSNLPPPRDMSVVDYEEAHGVQPVLGAYITDVFSNDRFPPDTELIMGDGRSYFDKDDPGLNWESCRRCLKKPRRSYDIPPPPPPKPPTTTMQTTTRDEFFEDEIDTTMEPDEEKRERRSYMDIERDYMKNPMMMDNKLVEIEVKEDLQVKDGLLDPAANYTLYVELIPGSEQDEPLFSDYVNALMPAASPVAPPPTTPLEIALLATCTVAGLIVVGMGTLCVLQARRSRKHHHHHLEMSPLEAAFRYVVGHIGGRQQLMSAVPPDMPPISKEDLAAAYAERQADSDYGFQKEFEVNPY